MCLPLYQYLFLPSLHLFHECDVSDIFKICTIKSGSNVRFADLQIAGGGQFETRLVRAAAGDQLGQDAVMRSCYAQVFYCLASQGLLTAD